MWSGSCTRDSIPRKCYYGVRTAAATPYNVLQCYVSPGSMPHGPLFPLPLPRASSPSFLPQGGPKPQSNQPTPFPSPCQYCSCIGKNRSHPRKKAKKKQFKTIKTIPIRKEKAIKKEKNRLLLTHSGPGVDKGTQQVRVR